MYRIQYRISNRHAWRFLSVRKLVPFTEDELSEYRKMIADKQAPKYVPWHAVQLKQVNGDSIVTGLCSHTAEDQETVTEWQAHKSRLYVNAGSGAIVADYMPRYAAHNPEFIPVQCGRVPAHIRKEFMQYV